MNNLIPKPYFTKKSISECLILQILAISNALFYKKSFGECLILQILAISNALFYIKNVRRMPYFTDFERELMIFSLYIESPALGVLHLVAEFQLTCFTGIECEVPYHDTSLCVEDATREFFGIDCDVGVL